MVQLTVSDRPDGGFVEGNLAYTKRWGIPINSRSLPSSGEVLVCDASSPVPNFRIEEAFMTLVALAQADRGLKVVTDVGCGGSYQGYGHFWNLSPRTNKFWLEFYEDTGIMDRINPDFAPVASDVREIVSLRRAAMLELWNIVAPYLGGHNGENFEIKIFEEEFSHLKISEIGDTVPQGAAILTYACPLCSHQMRDTVYHAIRRSHYGIDICKSERGQGYARCKSVPIWKEAWNSLTVGEAAFSLGARFSGKAIYNMSSLAENKSPIMIRDYSDPRGTIKTTVDNWTQDIWISPRVYLTQNGEKDFKSSIAADPKGWAKVISEFPLFGDGRQYDVCY